MYTHTHIYIRTCTIVCVYIGTWWLPFWISKWWTNISNDIPPPTHTFIFERLYVCTIPMHTNMFTLVQLYVCAQGPDDLHFESQSGAYIYIIIHPRAHTHLYSYNHVYVHQNLMTSTSNLRVVQICMYNNIPMRTHTHLYSYEYVCVHQNQMFSTLDLREVCRELESQSFHIAHPA